MIALPERFMLFVYDNETRNGDGVARATIDGATTVDALSLATYQAKQLARQERDKFVRIERIGDFKVVGRDIHLDWFGTTNGEIRFGQEWSW